MAKVSTDRNAIEEVLTRSIDSVYPSKEALRAALASGRRLRIYIGVDPTGSHLHFGQLTNLLVLKKFQKLGHEIIFLIGDFTARIGDPSDKLAARKVLNEEEVNKNLKDFKNQASQVISFSGDNAAKVDFNARWHSKLTFADVVKLATHFTVQQMLERDMFQKRLKANRPISLQEFFYPLMQGYDSVAMDVDVELGGTDQTFNMLAGRTLLKAYKNKEKFVLTTKLLENPKTGQKLMNKSEGGMINLDDSATDIFGKTMALSDESMFAVAEFCTEMPMDEVISLRREVGKGMNPRDAKLRIAEAVVTTVKGKEAAIAARRNFEKLFSKGEIPDELPELAIKRGSVLVVDVVVKSGVAKSKSEARRLVVQGGFEFDGEVVRDPERELKAKGGEVVRIGKKRFFRLKI